LTLVERQEAAEVARSLKEERERERRDKFKEASLEEERVREKHRKRMIERMERRN